MKRVLSLVLSLVMVLGMMPTFAAGETGAEMLQTNGFITGGTDGDLMEDKELTRAEMAVVLSELFGVKEEAMNYAVPADFTDVETHWAKSYIAYGQANDWFGGYPDGTYLPEGIVSGNELAAFVLNALGYQGDYEFADAIATAATMGIVISDAPALTRGVAFENVWTTVNTATKGSDVPLGVQLGKLAPVVVVPTELEVESVTTDNLAEVMVMFNRDLTAEEEDVFEDEDIYDIGGVTVDSAVLDGDTVTIALDTDVDVLTANDEYTLEVDSDMINEDYDFVAYDTAVPQALSIELTGPQSVEITFSEPISADNSDIEIDIEDGEYGATGTPDGSNVVDVELGSSLDEGDYEFVITGAQDFAGYTALRKVFTLNYVEDTTAPMPTLVSADQTEVVIDFGKPVTDEDGEAISRTYFYHSYTSYKPSTDIADEGDDPEYDHDSDDSGVEWDGSEVTLDFSEFPLPEGDVKIVVDYNANDSVITDLWGNEMEDNAVFMATIVADNTKPTVTKLEAADELNLEITFSEGLDSETAVDEDNYVVLDEDEEEVDIDDISYDDDDYIVTITFEEEQDGNYTIEITGVTDDSLSANKILAKTYAFTMDDSTGIDLDADITADAADGDSKDYIYVRFDDDMNETAIDSDNYQVRFDKDGDGFDDEKWASFDSDDKFAFFGDKDVVKISIADEDYYGEYTTVDEVTTVGEIEDLANAGRLQIRVAALEDAEGNTPDAFSSDPITVSATMPPKIDSVADGDDEEGVVMVDYKTIKLTYSDTVLTTVSTKGYDIENTVKGNTLAPASVSFVVDGGDSIVTLKLKSDVQLTDDETTSFADDSIVVHTNANYIKADTGLTALVGSQSAVDGISPMIVDATFTTATIVGVENVIYVEFSEDLDALDNLAAADFLVYDEDGDKLVAGTSSATTKDFYVIAGSSADTIYVVLVNDYAYGTYDDDVEFGTVDSPDYVQDESGNLLESYDVDDLDYSTDGIE